VPGCDFEQQEHIPDSQKCKQQSNFLTAVCAWNMIPIIIPGALVFERPTCST